MTSFTRSIGIGFLAATLLLIAGAFWKFADTRPIFRLLSTHSRIVVPQEYSSHDQDKDGVNDTQDLIDGARKEVARAPVYRSAYYQDGLPPEDEGVCTDVVWRAFLHAGYDLKSLVDSDIKSHLSAYDRIQGKPDPNIDFRRVPNLVDFFKSHAHVLTTELKPGDVQNLAEWQGGDIVMFGAPAPHIGILSDVRDVDGVPFMIHASGSSPKEDDGLLYWSTHLSPIVAHIRWPAVTTTTALR
ncbi:MAG: DUF1287 domain-containing protein [Patescibacteria group bacterium]